MDLLLDANLSWRLVLVLNEHFNSCLHIDHAGLSNPAKDIEIWEFAREKNLIIVTNDEDFLNLINLRGFPPKIILLRTGNQSNRNIAKILIQYKSHILQLSRTNKYGLLEII